MKKIVRFFVVCFVSCLTMAVLSCAKTMSGEVQVTTFAGSGEEGYANGTGTEAQFYGPFGLAFDKAGNLYVADEWNNRIRKISPKGEVTTFAGSGEEGYAAGISVEAQFYGPTGLAFDKAGNLYVAEERNNRIRKINPRVEVTAFAGDGKGSYANGTGVEAQFCEPFGLAFDRAGNLYVADSYNNRIRKISPKGEVTTFAGSGEEGYANGAGTEAQFNSPGFLVFDKAGNLYVADTGNNRIRKISPKGEVTTFAGSGEEGYANGTGVEAQFYGPAGLAFDKAGNLYVADMGNHRIRKISPKGEVTTFAGSGEEGYANGAGTEAQFYGPVGLAFDKAGNLYVADMGNHRIRKISPKGEAITFEGSREEGGANGIVGEISEDETFDNIDSTVSGFERIIEVRTPRMEGDDIVKLQEQLVSLGYTSIGEIDGVYGPYTAGAIKAIQEKAGLEVNGIVDETVWALVFSDSLFAGSGEAGNEMSGRVQVITFAGNGREGYADGTGIKAQFAYPTDLAFDRAGDLYVADTGNNRIRKISPKGEVTTFVESGEIINGVSSAPSSLVFDTAGNLYTTNVNSVLIISPRGETTTFEEWGNADSAYETDTDPQYWPRYWWRGGFVFDKAGNLYITESGDLDHILKISPGGEVTTFAGSGREGYADGTGIKAQFADPTDLAFDKAGNLYVADTGNNRIRKISPKGEVTTFAGSGETGYADGTGIKAQFAYPRGLAFDKAGNLYVADSYNNRIRKISPQGEVTTFAGSGREGYADGTGTEAQFTRPESLAFDKAGNLYVADMGNHRIRKISPGR
jgi:sugar lactone lactonase YvrE